MKKLLLPSLACMLLVTLLKAQPVLVKAVPTASTDFTEVGNTIFFTSHDSLFVTDGTTSGTALVKSGLNNIGNLIASNGLLYFVVSGNQLWRSNGTGTGTYLLKNFSIGNIQYAQTSGPYLYFTAAEAATGKELYRTNGTAGGTILLKDIHPGAGSGVGGPYVSYGNYLYFPGTSPTTGTELWRTDGTASGTILLQDVNPGTSSGFISGPWVAGGGVYFSANDGTHGTEIWKTNGSAAGTQLVKDVDPGTANGFSFDTLVSSGNTLYFFANETNHSFELWKSDGTSSGTTLVKEIDLGSDSYWGRDFLFTDNNNVYFYAYNNSFGEFKLWKSDGTFAGTFNYYTLQTEFEGFQYQAVVNSRFFGILRPSGDRALLLVTDGTAAGSFRKDIPYTGETSVFHFSVVNNHVVYGATGQNDYFMGYYKSDGTPAGTFIFYPGSANRPLDFEVVGDNMFFNQNQGSGQYEEILRPEEYKQLFFSDLNNTYSLRNLYGISMEGSGNLINHNGVLYFTTFNDLAGYGYGSLQPSADQTIKRLWRFDPATTSCYSEGGILRQAWSNIPGNIISNIPLDSVVPSITDTIDIFEGPVNAADSYGARYRGYICVPVTGTYTFWIASDDKSELFLSTDALPENKEFIAHVDNFTNSREWNKYPSQQSAPVNLIGGRRYYIEAFHKEHSGSDNLAVGWMLPDGTLERPIPGSRLSPYQNRTPGIVFIGPVNNQTFITPDYIPLEINVQDWDGNVLKVEIYADDVKLGEAIQDPSYPNTYYFKWETISIGSHDLIAKAHDNEGGISLTAIRVNIQSGVTNNAFTLVNADTDQSIRFMAEGEVIYLSGNNINIRYNATQNPGSVKFLLNGAPYSAENTAPYALAGDQNGNYNAWSSVAEGGYTLEAREYSNSGGTGTLLKTSIIHFEIVRPDGNLPPVVNAGSNMTIQLPQNSVNLNGSAYDPDGSIVYANWVLVSAPASIPVIVNSNDVLGTASYLTVPGTYIFRLIAWDNFNLRASDEVTVTVTSPTPFVVSHFTLVNAETDETLYTIYPGHPIDIPAFFNYKLNIVAHTYPSDVGSVLLNFDGYIRRENVAPYSLFGDNNGDYNSSPISAGAHTIVATPYSGSNTTGIQGPPLSVSFNMVNPSARISAGQGKNAAVICYPNPSAGSVNIELISNSEGYGKVEIYDAMGRLRATLFEGSISQDQQLNLNWDGSNEGKGLYFLNTSLNSKNEIHKIILK